jgi:hypothetical protein
MTHTLLDLPDVQLTEGEAVLGVIQANSVQPRLRKDSAYRMTRRLRGPVLSIRGTELEGVVQVIVLLMAHFRRSIMDFLRVSRCHINQIDITRLLLMSHMTTEGTKELC